MNSVVSSNIGITVVFMAVVNSVLVSVSSEVDAINVVMVTSETNKTS